MTEEAQTPYEILGDDGIKELAHVFYDVMDESCSPPNGGCGKTSGSSDIKLATLGSSAFGSFDL